MTASIIAIDGPVASGKSSIGKRLADRLGYLFFDTGVMYRAVTFLALRGLGSADDAAAVTALARRAHIDILPPNVVDGRDSTILAGFGARDEGGAALEDISWASRSKDVENNVSLVAAVPEVRAILTEQMRRRRFDEVAGRGEARDHADVLANLRERDRIDSSRVVAPLRPAPDAVVLDTTDLSLDQVLDRIQDLIG